MKETNTWNTAYADKTPQEKSRMREVLEKGGLGFDP